MKGEPERQTELPLGILDLLSLTSSCTFDHPSHRSSPSGLVDVRACTRDSLNQADLRDLDAMLLSCHLTL